MAFLNIHSFITIKFNFFLHIPGYGYILLLILFVTDESTPQKGLLSKFFQPELNNFTTPHPSADVIEPLDNLAVPAGVNQASENETEIALIHVPSQRTGEESTLQPSTDPSNQDNYLQINTFAAVSTLV